MTESLALVSKSTHDHWYHLLLMVFKERQGNAIAEKRLLVWHPTTGAALSIAGIPYSACAHSPDTFGLSNKPGQAGPRSVIRALIGSALRRCAGPAVGALPVEPCSACSACSLSQGTPVSRYKSRLSASLPRGAVWRGRTGPLVGPGRSVSAAARGCAGLCPRLGCPQ